MNLMDKVNKFLINEIGAIGGSFELDPFTFNLEYIPATNLTTVNDVVQIQADSAFVIVKTDAVVTATNNTTFNTIGSWPFLLTLSDSGSGRDLMDSGVHLYNICGTGERPFIWSKPKMLDPNSVLTGKLQNLSGTDYNVRIGLHGFKVFGSIQGYKSSLRRG